MWRFMSEFVFWDSDMERFSVCESDSQINTPPPTLSRGTYTGVGGGAYKRPFGDSSLRAYIRGLFMLGILRQLA